MNYSQIKSALSNLSSAELSQLNVDVIEVIKLRRRTEAGSVKRTISYGSVVVVNHPKAAGKTFTVNEIKRTKAILVDNDTNQRISAPLSLISSKY